MRTLSTVSPGALAIAAGLAFALAANASAQTRIQTTGGAASGDQAPAPAAPPYAELVALADRTPLVAKVLIRTVIPLRPDEGRAARPGFARVYIEARTAALLVGEGLGESVRYLADVPTDSRGRALRPRGLAIVFAAPVPGKPGEIALIAPDAQRAWSPALEARLRPILAALIAPDAPPRITAVRDALHVPGALAGEGATQIFLATTAAPLTITVTRRPGQPPAWGVSAGELVDPAARPPARDTLLWYRLACALPAALPGAANLAPDAADRATAAADYALVRGELGACGPARAAPPAP